MMYLNLISMEKLIAFLAEEKISANSKLHCAIVTTALEVNNSLMRQQAKKSIFSPIGDVQPFYTVPIVSRVIGGLPEGMSTMTVKRAFAWFRSFGFATFFKRFDPSENSFTTIYQWRTDDRRLFSFFEENKGTNELTELDAIRLPIQDEMHTNAIAAELLSEVYA